VIALIAALWNEISDLVKAPFVEKSISQPGLRLWYGEYAGQKALLVQTGMGRERAESATRYVLKNYPVRTALSFGFGGALVPHLKIADLIFCQGIHCAGGAHPGQVFHSDRDLLTLAARLSGQHGLRAQVGMGLTVDHVVCRPQDKHALGRSFAAQVVDMESYWIAGLAANGGCRFLGLRSISDTVAQSLPPFDRFVAPSGEWLWREMAAYLLARPGLLAGLPSIALHARQARRSLAQFLPAFLLAHDEVGSDE
jgi:adenosylhomocysteine nucleosidase